MLEGMQQVADALTSRVEVSDVQVNPQTGSILVRYDPERGSLNDLCSALRQLVLQREFSFGISCANFMHLQRSFPMREVCGVVALLPVTDNFNGLLHA